MVPVNVYAYAVLSTPQILGFTSGYILLFLRGTPQNLTRLNAYASGSPDDPCKLTIQRLQSVRETLRRRKILRETWEAIAEHRKQTHQCHVSSGPTGASS